MLVLGIETSCDETSAALVDDGEILSNIVATQMIHEEFGGVVPEFASRAHMQQLIPIIKTAFIKAGKKLSDIDGLAVTRGPGLAGSLMVGLCICKGLALSLQKPWIGVNHIEGHISATFDVEKTPPYPNISLVISGGHTLLIYVKKPLNYITIGRTIDDAAGEAFDKVAKTLGLGYPGGPAIERAAHGGNPAAVDFPRALMERDNLNFSFSGVKTAVLYHVNSLKKADINISDIAASFQKAVVDVLIEKALRALRAHRCKTLVLAGGVVRNKTLRKEFEISCVSNQIDLFFPAPELCTDNAAMIARAGHQHLIRGESSSFDTDVAPNLSVDERF